MSGWREARSHVSATSLFEWWDGRMAAAALTAAAATPALLAAIDQHGAAVRDALLVDVALDPVSAMESLVMGAAGLVVAPPLIHLAAYLRGVLDQAHTDGWHPPETAHEHTCSDWVALRVTAICALARAHSMHAQPDPTA